jgi:hypothetical protein
MKINWAKTRSVLFFMGLGTTPLPLALMAIGHRYLKLHFELWTSGQFEEKYYWQRWATSITLAIWISALSLVLVTFGRRWPRLVASLMGIAIFLAALGSM